VHLREVSAVLDLHGDTVRIARFSARAGSGTLSASGTVGLLAPDVPVDLRVGASRARLLSSDLITVNLNANVTVAGQGTKQLLLAGNIHVNKAEIRIPETLPTSVATLNVKPLGQKPLRPAPPGPTISLDLTVDAPREIFVRGRGLDAELGGRVRVRGTAKDPQPLGSFHLLRGQFTMAGQTLTFSTGEVSFNGGSLTDPSLDFTVTTTNGTTTATLNIAGTVSSPKITLSSTPTLPQDEIVSQLLFGRSASSLSPFELAEIASAVAQLTGVTSGGLNPLGKIRKGLGLDQLAVGTGATGQPTLEAGRYVAPGVYVGVEQGTTAGSTKAKVQVDLTKRLKLEGTVGTSSSSATGAAGEGGSSVGISYQLEY
jgi:translocation and assembly module TamB